MAVPPVAMKSPKENVPVLHKQNRIELLPITKKMSVCLEESYAACRASRPEKRSKRDVLHDEYDAPDSKSNDDFIGTAASAPFIVLKHSYALPPFNPLLLQQPKIEPLQMSSLQTKFIVETMDEMRYSNSSKRRKTETEHGQNFDRGHFETFSSLRRGNRANDNDSITSSCRSDSSSLDLFDALEAHPNVIQLIASSGGLITHCKSSSSLTTQYLTGSY